MKDMLLGLGWVAVVVMAMFVWAAFRNAGNVERRLSILESREPVEWMSEAEFIERMKWR